jgi:hypothetical protein
MHISSYLKQEQKRRNSLRLHVAKKFRLVSAPLNAYLIFKNDAIL